MKTIIEEKLDILEQVFISEEKFISDNLLKKESVFKSLLQDDLKNDAVSLGNIIYKLKVDTIIKFYQKEIISDDDLVKVFAETNFSRSKMIGILRKMKFDDRKRITMKLKNVKYELFEDIDDKINAKFAMVAGILMKDVSQKAKIRLIFDELVNKLDDIQAVLDDYKQYLYLIYKNDLSEYIGFVNDVLLLKKEIFNENPIEHETEFAVAVKVAYMLTIGDDIADKYEKENVILMKRFLSGLELFLDGNSILIILEQLPEYYVGWILERIIKRTYGKDFKVRNKAIKMKKFIEDTISNNSYLHVRKCIQEFDLDYNIKNM